MSLTYNRGGQLHKTQSFAVPFYAKFMSEGSEVKPDPEKGGGAESGVRQRSPLS
ncbi:MAG: hypothetical protein P5702_17700 [Limnospira sp. PMC 1291.21]|uniref:Uncharacterized protein n=2 Tax=Limnospira TaxID=2596745 RepID=A0A9P1KC13_9CYAN|nr:MULTISPECIES: hypothetical protein [Limnospira]MBD2670905.1 hypothetical protein [Arthrospira platensis FACHB-439]MDC0836276.1 hypothetical protein [Limnoraphis robusta]MDY7054499.1 hypothetical protein [Limnospira fusiformis LS22]MDT9177477.1 hypothetical protein [Limnospira sp. PMC 1238.20]MDT9187669.1 hypothetical protein [Limnospira sp. PMC 894.15]